MLNLLKDIFPVTIGLVIIGAISFLIFLPAIASWKLFKKAGIPGWKSLIPFYNNYLLFKIAGMPGICFIIPLLINIINTFLDPKKLNNTQLIVVSVAIIIDIVVFIIQSIKLSKSFGKGKIFIIFMIICPDLAKFVLGVGKSKYIGNYNKKNKIK